MISLTQVEIGFKLYNHQKWTFQPLLEEKDTRVQQAHSPVSQRSEAGFEPMALTPAPELTPLCGYTVADR